jgi:hypothetical protein
MKKTLAKEMIESAHAYKNTYAWEHNGSVFIDSMKYPSVFLSVMAEDFNVTGEILHEEKSNPDILMGNKGTGLIFGGRDTICHVVEFKLPPA